MRGQQLYFLSIILMATTRMSHVPPGSLTCMWCEMRTYPHDPTTIMLFENEDPHQVRRGAITVLKATTRPTRNTHALRRSHIVAAGVSRLSNRVHNMCMHALSSDGRFLNQGRDRSPSPQLGSIGITISDTVPSILPSAGHRRTPHPVPTFVDFDVSSFNNGQVIRILTIDTIIYHC